MRPILFIGVSLSFAYCTFAVGDALLSTNLARLAPGFALRVEPHKIVERGDSQRIWEQVKYLTNFNLPIPRVEIITNRYTELGGGICFQQPDGKWADSQARFVLALDGSVEATEIPHKVRLNPQLRSIGAVKMTLPDGQLMSSTFRGLYLHDASTQKRLLVSDITNSIGTLISSNVIVYSNCFASLKGDLVLKVTPADLPRTSSFANPCPGFHLMRSPSIQNQRFLKPGPNSMMRPFQTNRPTLSRPEPLPKDRPTNYPTRP